MAADATMYRPTTTTSNLIVSDGYVRRIYFDFDINQLDENASVHAAFVRFKVAPSNAFLGEQRVVLYVPDSRDPNARGFRTGPLVWSITMDSTSTNLEFPLTATVLALLEGEVQGKGFVIRYADEPSELRYREFYSSSAIDSLRPRVYVTSSTPAEFE
jgi:hypothetical protein